MKLFISGLTILLLLGGLKTCQKSLAESTNKISARESAERLLKFIETGDTLNLRGILVDSVLKSTPVEEFVSARLQIIEQIGPVTRIEGPKLESDSEALAWIFFGDSEAELSLTFDKNGKINSLRFSPLAPDDLRPKVSWEELGEDTLQISYINQLDQFRRIFQKDKGKVRLVSLLSPT